MLETSLASFLVSLKGEFGDLINDVLSTSRVTGRNEELGEHNLLRGSPALGCPELPLLGVGVHVVIEHGLLLSQLLLGRDLRKRSSGLLE